jgi:hypothetical protein
MRRPQGYAVTVDPDGPTVEEDTFTCKHCNSIVFVKPGAPASACGGWCGRCAANICGPCADEMSRTLKCRPFEKWLDKVEARDRLRAAL